jgi:kumamolisin
MAPYLATSLTVQGSSHISSRKTVNTLGNLAFTARQTWSCASTEILASRAPIAFVSPKSIAFSYVSGHTLLSWDFKSLGLAVKPVVFHGVDGAKNAPGDPNGADGEVMLDLCVVGGMAPGAELHCYMGPNTDAGFLAAINQAVVDKMDAISISWGGPEDQWSAASIAQFNDAFIKAAQAGITVTAAAGDSGSGDGEPGQHVDFPASSPYVLACGGTTITAASSRTEVVWNDGQGDATGGGVSALFALPSWQRSANIPGGKFRGVPDVAGNADPNTGWIVIVDGQETTIGGTSAVAPMWAALSVCLSQALGRNVGFMNPQLYSVAGWARDITSGNNGTYVARAGYDCCTGEGVPVGTRLLAAMQPAPAPDPPAHPDPTPPSTPAQPAPTVPAVTLQQAIAWATAGLTSNWPKQK